MSLWYCGLFYRVLPRCWGCWTDLAPQRSPPSPLFQVWSSCFSSASSLKWKQKHKQMNRSFQPAPQQRERGQSGQLRGAQGPNCLHPSRNPPRHQPLVCEDPFGSQEFGSQDLTILSFLEPKETRFEWEGRAGEGWGTRATALCAAQPALSPLATPSGSTR